MKGYEIIKKIANKEIPEGTKLKDNYNTYIMTYDDFTETELDLRKSDTHEIPDYSFFADNDNEFEIIEENKTIEEDKPIEELKTEYKENERYIYGISGNKYSMRVIDCIFSRKINELVKEINKMKEELNGKNN